MEHAEKPRKEKRHGLFRRHENAGHAEYIAEAVSYTKDTFLQIDGLITWAKLFLGLIIPFLAGLALATLFLQLLIKPLLVNLLVVPTLGFTEDGISHMLQYLAGLLALACIFLIPFYQGYLSRSMKNREVQKVTNFWGLFFSGWKVNALILYYVLPLIVIFILYAVLFTYLTGALDVLLSGNVSGLASLIDYASLAVYLGLEFVTAIFLGLFACIGFVHLARTGSFKESVNMGGIAEIIKRIGWYDYLLGIVIMTIILLSVIVFFLGMAGILGYTTAANLTCFCLALFVLIPTGVFLCRYLANIYDAAFTEQDTDIEEFDDF